MSIEDADLAAQDLLAIGSVRVIRACRAQPGRHSPRRSIYVLLVARYLLMDGGMPHLAGHAVFGHMLSLDRAAVLAWATIALEYALAHLGGAGGAD